MNELQKVITEGSSQYYEQELKKYVSEKFNKYSDVIQYVIYKLHLFKRCNPSILLGSIRHRFNTLDEMKECISICVKEDLITWNQENELFITKLTDAHKSYGYRYPDVVEHRKIKDYYLNTLYQIPLKLNPFTQQLRETKIKYPKFNMRVKEGYSLIKSNTVYINWFYDYRGRAYANQYYMNPCGTSFNKSMFLIPEKK